MTPSLKYLGLVLDDLKSGAQLFDAYFEQMDGENEEKTDPPKLEGRK
jgi:hypothetical protein